MKELELILNNIKTKEFLPIYFFHGEEAYFIDIAVKALENGVLPEDDKAFNQTILYGKDTNYNDILAFARQYPMLGDKQLIIVKEAQDLKLIDIESKILENYVENPVASTILVFAHKHKKADSRKKAFKTLAKKKMLFLSEAVRDYNLAKWIENEAKNLKINLAPGISQLLADYLGNDLSRIANELNKMKLVIKEGEVLDGKLVESHIGISKEFNVFELQKALGKKDANNAFKIAYYMGKNPKTNPIIMTIGNLYNFFSNIIMYHSLAGQPSHTIASEMGVNPYFIKDYADYARFFPLKNATRTISILREIDLKSKGLGAVNMEEGELLKEMVFKLLNVEKIKK